MKHLNSRYSLFFFSFFDKYKKKIIKKTKVSTPGGTQGELQTVLNLRCSTKSKREKQEKG